MVGETGPEIALVGEEGPELVLTAKQTRDVLGIIANPGDASEIKTVPINAFDNGGITGRTYTEIVEEIERQNQEALRNPETYKNVGQSVGPISFSNEQLANMVEPAMPSGESYTTNALKKLVGSLDRGEPVAPPLMAPDVTGTGVDIVNALAMTALETAADPRTTALGIVAPMARPGLMFAGNLAKKYVAKEVAQEAAEAAAKKEVAQEAVEAAATQAVTGPPPVRTGAMESFEEIVERSTLPTELSTPTLQQTPWSSLRPVETVDEAVEAVAKMSDQQKKAVQQSLGKTDEQIAKMNDKQFNAYINKLTREKKSTKKIPGGQRVPTKEYRIMEAKGEVPSFTSGPGGQVARTALLNAVNQVNEIQEPDLFDYMLGMGSYQSQTVEDAFVGAQDERNRMREQSLYEALRAYGTDREKIEDFQEYGQSTAVMRSILNRIEAKGGKNLTATEEAALIDPQSVLNLFQSFGTLRGQDAQQSLALIIEKGKPTTATDLQEQRNKRLEDQTNQVLGQ